MNASNLLAYLPTGTDSVMGRALLVFDQPKGQIVGAAELWFSTPGRPHLRVQLEEFHAAAPYDRHPVAFLAGTKPVVVEGVVSYNVDGGERRFSSLVFDTDGGTFSATAGLVQADTIYPTVDTITATVLDLIFTPNESREPHFWLATLHGSCADFALKRPAEHVLAFADRSLYPFKDGQLSCAFQPLVYKEENCGVAVDAILFGDLAVSQDLSNPAGVLPLGLLNALQFALGAQIQMSRLELRDEDGHLVKRAFFSTSAETGRSNSPCLTIFDNGTDSGLSSFLSKFLAIPHNARRGLISATNLVRMGSPGGEPIENSITDLVRAMDSLVRRSALAQQNLLNQLKAHSRQRVQEIIKEASAQVRQLRISVGAKDSETATLERIEGRINNAASTDLNFGLSLRLLTQKHSLNDFTVLQAHCAAGATYEGLLSFMRGQVVHEGHLNIETRSQLRTWFEFAQHLHDLCKRLILLEVSYGGTYQASNAKWLGPRNLDWVKSDMTIENLGFSEGLPKLP